MDPDDEYCPRYIRNRCLVAEDSGFNSTDTMAQGNDGWGMSLSPESSSPSYNSHHFDHYGVFFMDEDINPKSFEVAEEEANAASSGCIFDSPADNQHTATSLHFPGVFVEGFCDGRVEFNIPGVMRDQFSPPDDINVHFKLPLDESGQMHDSDLDCLTKAGEVMNQWRQQQTSGRCEATEQSETASYRSYFEGFDSQPNCTGS